LAGRVPTFEQVKAFLADNSAVKRDKLIDTLLSSPAYVDQFSFWFHRLLQQREARLLGQFHGSFHHAIPGFHTSCVSCHNGRGRLEKINLFLAPIQRSQFWQLSAFFPRTRIQIVTEDAAAYRLRLIFSDARSGGGYNGIVNPAAPAPLLAHRRCSANRRLAR
jgi:hypothetical protein